MSRFIIAFAFLTSACQADETITAYISGSGVFELVSLDGAPLGAEATIDLSQSGRIQGQAPCNRYFADQKTVYPWFEAGPIGATRMACDKLAEENAFFAALSEMTLSEASGGTLILSNPEGREMVFQAP